MKYSKSVFALLLIAAASGCGGGGDEGSKAAFGSPCRVDAECQSGECGGLDEVGNSLGICTSVCTNPGEPCEGGFICREDGFCGEACVFAEDEGLCRDGVVRSCDELDARECEACGCEPFGGGVCDPGEGCVIPAEAGEPCTAHEFCASNLCDFETGKCSQTSCADLRDELMASAKESCFEPCGGSPFGLWMLEGTCTSRKAGEGPAECGAYGKFEVSSGPFLIEFREGGSLSTYGSPPALEVFVEDSEACGRSSDQLCNGAGLVAGEVLNINYAGDNGASCDAHECQDTCSCWGPREHQPQTWSLVDGVLNTAWSMGTSPHSYCVTNDELWMGGEVSIWNPDRGSVTAAYRFRKVECKGTPVPCEERTAEQCPMAGGDCELIPGRCDGDDCSAYGTEEACGVQQGCSWTNQPYCTGLTFRCSTSTCLDTPGCYLE